MTKLRRVCIVIWSTTFYLDYIYIAKSLQCLAYDTQYVAFLKSIY